MKHLKIKVHGSVHGVGFRGAAKREADILEIAGFVRNQKDGTVNIEAEGEEAALNEFLEWCRNGPEIAKVEKVEVVFSDDIRYYKEFRIQW